MIKWTTGFTKLENTSVNILKTILYPAKTRGALRNFKRQGFEDFKFCLESADKDLLCGDK